MAAFFLADFLVGFFLGAFFAALLPEVSAPPDLPAADCFLPAAFRAPVVFFPAACFLPRDFVVLPAGGLRLAFFFAVLAVLDRFVAVLRAPAVLDRFAAFLRGVAVLDRFVAFLRGVAVLDRFAAFLRGVAVLDRFAAVLRPPDAFFAMVPSFSDS